MNRRLPWLTSLLCIGCFTDPPPITGDDSTGPGSTGEGETSTSDGSGDSTTTDPDTTATVGETDTTTGPPPACDEPDGTFEGTCSDAAPFCVGGECVPCSQDDPLTMCANDPGRPVCAPSGACVECTAESADGCTGGDPYCDPATNACVPCAEHAHCGEAGCNLFTGECVPGPVVHVGPGQRHSTLGAAVTAVSGGSGGTVIVHAGTYDEAIVVGGGAVVAFLANEGDVVQWRHTNMGDPGPQLRVTGDATVLMDDIDLRLNPSAFDPALRVDGASLWVDRGVVAQNDGVAVRAESSAEVRLRNCFIGGATALPALHNITGSNVTLEFTTVGAGPLASNAIRCDGGSSATVSDSILLTQGSEPEADCAMLTADHTVANEMLPGAANFGIGATMTGWFGGYSTGDFHLTASGQTAFEDRAEWNHGDPTSDIDGDDRSSVGPSMHAGADLP